MFRPLFLCAVVLLAPLVPQPALACTCLRREPDEAARRATAIFEGRVLELRPGPEGQRSASLQVSLRVVRNFKGETPSQVVVTTARDSAGCGYAFELDRSYLVYADGQPEQLRVSLCGHTKPMADAAPELELLGMGTVPIEPDPLEEPEAGRSEPPARGGCAGCSLGRSGPEPGLPGAAVPWLIGLLWGVRTWRRRRRSP